ncbi:sulfite exporter TauE/SafE family protein [Thalassotalea piscium]
MDWVIIALAGFIGGMLNAVAGGGSFITLPALIFVGIPPIIANATGTAALLPGYIASAWRFRKDVTLPASLSFIHIFLLAIAGGSIGAVILLMSSEQVFSYLIPWLILFATLAFIIGPTLIKNNGANKSNSNNIDKLSVKTTVGTSLVLLGICIYGGYFNGGLGIIVLAALVLMGQTNLHGMNGLKNVLSAILTVVAVCIYAAGGTLSFKYLAVMSIAAVIGGYLGAVVAYRLSQKYLRYFIVTVGCIMSVVFFYKNS